MTDDPCPMDPEHEPLRHPDAMLCYRCVHRLPQRFRRALRRINAGPDRTPQGDKATLRAELLQRCRTWLDGHPAGEPHVSTKGSR